MHRQPEKYLKNQSGATLITILVLGAVIAMGLVWTMNLMVNEEKMQQVRKTRTDFESLLSSLRRDFQDGYQCSRMIAGQPFPHWNNLANPGGNEADIQIRNFKWRTNTNTPVTFAPPTFPNYLSGDSPMGPGTDIRQIGVHIRSLKIRRGLIYPIGAPAPFPTFREQPNGTPLTQRQLWGQDRWYRPVFNSLSASIANLSTGAGMGVNPSIYGMIFAAEIIIEPEKINERSFIFNARDESEPMRRIQIYVKAAYENNNRGTIIGCYGPTTAAQLCDRSGGSFYTFPTTAAVDFARYYCHPDQYCWTQRIAGAPMFGPANLASCALPFTPQLVGNFVPAGPTYTCTWCNPNLPVMSLGSQVPGVPDYSPVVAPSTPINDTRQAAQRPNVFGGSTAPYF